MTSGNAMKFKMSIKKALLGHNQIIYILSKAVFTLQL